eukprot:1632320-Pleurochrysis_carterae.AAC.1
MPAAPPTVPTVEPQGWPLLQPAASVYRPGTAQTKRASSDTLPSSNASSPLRALMEREDDDQDEYSPASSAEPRK